jgi:hypothetical protein
MKIIASSQELIYRFGSTEPKKIIGRQFSIMFAGKVETARISFRIVRAEKLANGTGDVEMEVK